MDMEKVIKAFDEAKELVWTDDDEYTMGYNNGLEAGKNIAISLLKEQEVKESKWLSLPYKKDRVCERCGHDEPYKFADKESDVFLYCPHCGAKMVNNR